MRQFKTAMYGTVDLDDEVTYKHLPDDVNELDEKMFNEIGKAICYMDYWYLEDFPKKRPKKTDINYWGYKQRKRVEVLIDIFTKERKNNYKNKMWYKEKLYILQDETENMC